MPRLTSEILNCSFYLYSSEESAGSGDSRGGSGFVVAALEAHPGRRGLLYAVTAGHVVGQASTLRFNRKSGEPLAINIPVDRWHRSEDHDLAVAPLSDVPTSELNLFLMPADLGLTRERCAEDGIGIGDDVFVVGRFLGHDGRERNLPTARFGNISMMPIEPIHNPHTGLLQESFLVELRTLQGYSGSPVFSYRDVPFGASTRLLGVVWGHIVQRTTLEEEVVSLQSGMAAVVPSWGLLDLLYSKELSCERERIWDQTGFQPR